MRAIGLAILYDRGPGLHDRATRGYTRAKLWGFAGIRALGNDERGLVLVGGEGHVALASLIFPRISARDRRGDQKRSAIHM